VAGVPFLDAFGCEGEVVEACLGCDLDAFCSSFAEHRDGFDGGEVNDVELEVWGKVG
jgi:hypothetical protein